MEKLLPIHQKITPPTNKKPSPDRFADVTVDKKRIYVYEKKNPYDEYSW